LFNKIFPREKNRPFWPLRSLLSTIRSFIKISLAAKCVWYWRLSYQKKRRRNEDCEKLRALRWIQSLKNNYIDIRVSGRVNLKEESPHSSKWKGQFILKVHIFFWKRQVTVPILIKNPRNKRYTSQGINMDTYCPPVSPHINIYREQ